VLETGPGTGARVESRDLAGYVGI